MSDPILQGVQTDADKLAGAVTTEGKAIVDGVETDVNAAASAFRKRAVIIAMVAILAAAGLTILLVGR